jgi:hypothetical protein
MAKKINVTGNSARRIEVTGKSQRRIKPEEFAAALGAEVVGEVHSSNLDPLSLAHLGSELIKRLRSSGGRPALADATEICRVPLSAEDLKSLETITERISDASGTKPSPGQLVSVIVREYLAGPAQLCMRGLSPSKTWPEGWNGKREKYQSVQQLIQKSGSTWVRKDAA